VACDVIVACYVCSDVVGFAIGGRVLSDSVFVRFLIVRAWVGFYGCCASLVGECFVGV